MKGNKGETRPLVTQVTELSCCATIGCRRIYLQAVCTLVRLTALFYTAVWSDHEVSSVSSNETSLSLLSVTEVAIHK